ncbi:hypothetical protein HZH68_016707 [Vespula germanica]|uniref:Uncharacterized protein n=1 Tax=Vespula germanica TaxID=30212 RepID=A0A834MQA9_VESGE|nr:hypothetical protein HZH68_016707 [Vespula germanica]
MSYILLNKNWNVQYIQDSREIQDKRTVTRTVCMIESRTLLSRDTVLLASANGESESVTRDLDGTRNRKPVGR